MVRAHRFEEACLEGVPSGEIHGELHSGIGQEGFAPDGNSQAAAAP